MRVFDRASQRLGIDHQPAVVRAHDPLHPHAARPAIDLDIGDFRDHGLPAERVGEARGR